MGVIKDKVIIPIEIINELDVALKTKKLDKLDLSIEIKSCSIFSSNISFKFKKYKDMYGEDYSVLTMGVYVFHGKGNIVFQYVFDIDVIEDIFEFIPFGFNKKSYIISIEETYNTNESYKRKKNVLMHRSNSKYCMENMLRFVNFDNKYSVVDIMFLVLFNIDILKEYDSLLDIILNKIDYYGCEIKENAVENNRSENCIAYMYEKLKYINNSKLILDTETVKNIYNIVYDDYIDGLIYEKRII